MGVPLTVKDRRIGIVAAQTYSAGVRYGQGELDILTFVSSQMAMAIERKRVEDAWREQSELLQRIVDNIPVMLVFLDDQGHIQWGNREWTRTLGYDIAEARERDLFAELYPDPGEQRRLRDSIGALVGQWTDFRTRTKHGTVLDTIWANAPLTGGGWLAIGMDVSERRRAEERYRSFIAQSSEGVSRLEVDPPVPLKLPEEEQVDRVYAGARIAECNDAMARMYGFKEARDLVGTRLAELHNVNDPTNREQIRSFIRAGYRVSNSETREHDREGRPRVFLNNVVGFVEDGQLVRVWGTQRDVTDQRHLEEQFRQSQKMEAVGQLAGGIAHDFNNLLTAILGNTQLLLRELPPGDSKRGDVEEIRKASERAASLTRQLLAYSRRQMLQPVVLDLNVVVAEMDKLLRRLIGEHIALVTVLAPDLGRVKADPNQLEQVIVNLAVNARDAMPEGGKLTIETANVDLDEGFAQAHLGSVPGAYAMLAVTDTGSGIPLEILPRIFDRFRQAEEPSTGRRHGGLGLGLAIAREVVERHGGTIVAESQGPGWGSTFTVTLPMMAEGLLRTPALSVDRYAASEEPVRLDGVRVLVVDDETDTRELLVTVLRDSGADATGATSVCQALEALLALNLNVLISDIGMLDEDGYELIRKVRALGPGAGQIPAIALTAYARRADRHRALSAGYDLHLAKPVEPNDLARTVANLVKRRQG